VAEEIGEALAGRAGAVLAGGHFGYCLVEDLLDQVVLVAVDYSTDDWPDRVRELTGGRGADLVLDAVGGAIVLTT
jgi:NADPH2:quinone reductase